MDEDKDLIQTIYTTDEDYIVAFSQKGGLFIFYPKMQDGKVIWTCEGGPEAKMPPECRHNY